jgi:hypothetical protein
MAKDAHGKWYPDIWGKQVEVFNSQKRIVLLSGPSLSGKTHIALHRLVRHMWETPGAQVAMFSKLLKNAKDGGTWKILHKRILPEWINAKMGLKYTTETPEGLPGPKTDGQTRTPYFRIRNAYGGESECMLFSLDHDHDIEAKIKEMEFSMIYFSELDKFRDRKVLSISLPRLRMAHLKYEQQMWLADTNPSDEGEQSWIYELWFIIRSLESYEAYQAFCKKRGQIAMPQDAFWQLKEGLELFTFTPRENPKVDIRQLIELESSYAYDEGLYQRYVNGAWVYGDGDSSIHFKNQFKEHIHVLGNVSSPNEDEWEYINPRESSYELVTGWDLGETNHAFACIDEEVVNGRLHFAITDELVSIRQEVSIEAFTEGAMELIEDQEGLLGRPFDLEKAWSDRSSIEKYSAAAGTFPHKQVNAASGNRIFLRGVPKAPGSVKVRVKLMKQLLAQNRIKVSAHCIYTIRMLKELKKGNTVLNYVVQDENKHIFDAITYALLMECSEELDDLAKDNVGKRQASSELSFVQI